MIKQVWVAQCDLCGKMENARIVPGRYNEQQVTLPIGWSNGYNKDFHCCPECSKHIAKEVGVWNEELKPCKCGSDVELCRGDDDYYIYCPKCKLKTFSDRVYDNITDNCDRLIEVWNRRAKGGRE